MKRTRLLPSILMSVTLGVTTPLVLAADNPAAGANSPRPSAGQPSGQQGSAPNTGSSTGATPRTSPSGSDDGGYSNDATVHRTGQDKRTNADGSDFEKGQNDGPDNTPYPGD